MKRTPALVRLESKLASDPCAILDDPEVRLLDREVRRALIGSFPVEAYLDRSQDTIRWHALGARCVEAPRCLVVDANSHEVPCELTCRGERPAPASRTATRCAQPCLAEARGRCARAKADSPIVVRTRNIMVADRAPDGARRAFPFSGNSR
jgi:hypothetical protein